MWRDDAPLGMLFVDLKARAVGDLLTVNIVEVASASNEATTGTTRASSVSASMEAMVGLEHVFKNPSKAISGSLANNFDGSGKTSRSGKVTATVTAVVREVLPNGNLVIEGRREITVNHERELIVLSGVVRPKDISPGNIVLSTALGHAKVAYYGSGIISEKQRPGWLARILDVVWPF
ncbi:MAG: flagellar basal body L-ring protein FlgH [Nitrospinae bacterium]|nr:flagellar basal body L-ring protein FlgH [Nitrospinota bacterium]